MRNSRPLLLGLGLLSVALAPYLLWADVPAVPAGPGAKDPLLEAKQLADTIDRHINAHLAEKGVQPAELTTDGEFLRRITLDLAGRIPKGSELLDFRDKYADNPRANWINHELLEGPEYVNHFATTWRHLLVPQDNGQGANGPGAIIELWLRQKFRENAHYDQMVRELIAPTYGRNQVVTNFFQANQVKPENLAATTSRLFMGVKLECAQCHDHPFARWTRKQFWEYAAFYAGLQPPAMRRGNPLDETAVQDLEERREITIPGTEKRVQARFLDETEPVWRKGQSTRMVLADWLLKPANPFFARAAVNRIWAHFFGLGLVEPVDDLSDQNPASHPELLEELARQFVAHDYDVKYLIRAITYSQTYQRSSAVSHPSQLEEPRLFSRMPLKGLTAEQLYDSLIIAIGTTPSEPKAEQMQRDGGGSPRAEFLAQFTSQDKRTEYQTSILQALTLMNGKIIAEATKVDTSETNEATLARALNEPLDTPQRVEMLYLAVYTRKPTTEETERLVKYIDSGGPRKDPKIALTDVFWALLNSPEFILNH